MRLSQGALAFVAPMFDVQSPNLTENELAWLTKSMQSLHLPLRARATGKLWGVYLGSKHGDGDDFAEIRAYQPGDDVRRIDWIASARAHALQVRKYYANVESDVYCLIDSSASMFFRGQAELSKLAYGLMMLAGIGAALLHNFHRLILAHHHAADHTWHSPPLTDVTRWAEWILRTARTDFTRPSDAGHDLVALLQTAISYAPPRAPVLLLTDLLAHAPWDHWVRALAEQHLLIVLRVLDVYELRLPDLGPLRLVDLESGEQVFLATQHEHVRRQFEERAQRVHQQHAAVMLRAGAWVIDILLDRHALKQEVMLHTMTHIVNHLRLPRAANQQALHVFLPENHPLAGK